MPKPVCDCLVFVEIVHTFVNLNEWSILGHESDGHEAAMGVLVKIIVYVNL